MPKNAMFILIRKYWVFHSLSRTAEKPVNTQIADDYVMMLPLHWPWTFLRVCEIFLKDHFFDSNKIKFKNPGK